MKRIFSHIQVEYALVVLLKVQHLVEESPNSLHRGRTEGQRQASPPRFEAPRPSSNRVSGLGKIESRIPRIGKHFSFGMLVIVTTFMR